MATTSAGALEVGTRAVYRWEVDAFLRAHDADAFDGRVELVDGEVWRVVLGDWHGRVTPAVVAVLLGHGEVRQSTLPSAGSLPDPDAWVLRAGARPVAAVSARLSRWDPADVLLVVEVSDETVEADLVVKASLYASAGYARYWVVTREGVHEHTEPGPDGYASVRLAGPRDEVTLPDGERVGVHRLLAG